MYKILSSEYVDTLNMQIEAFQAQNTVFSMQFQTSGKNGTYASTVYSVLVEYRPGRVNPVRVKSIPS